METCSVVLQAVTLRLLTKSYGVTIQIKPLQQYFCIVPFVSQHFKKLNLEFSLNFVVWHFWELRGLSKKVVITE